MIAKTAVKDCPFTLFIVIQFAKAANGCYLCVGAHNAELTISIYLWHGVLTDRAIFRLISFSANLASQSPTGNLLANHKPCIINCLDWNGTFRGKIGRSVKIP